MPKSRPHQVGPDIVCIDSEACLSPGPDLRADFQVGPDIVDHSPGPDL